jgi:ferredoxin
MRVEVRAEECQAYGNCQLSAPEVFDLTEETGTVVLLQERPADELHAKVTEAALSCPMQALILRHD